MTSSSRLAATDAANLHLLQIGAEVFSLKHLSKSLSLPALGTRCLRLTADFPSPLCFWSRQPCESMDPIWCNA